MATDLLRKAREKERGLAVVDVREAARLTQDELADLLTEFGSPASKQTVSNIERAYSGGNDLRRLEDIAAVCAGRGWLPDDEDAIRAFILGERKDLPAKMLRRRLGPVGTGDGASNDSLDGEVKNLSLRTGEPLASGLGFAA